VTSRNHQFVANSAAALCAALACVGTGVLMVGHLHKSLVILPAVALVFAAVVLIIAELGTTALLIWIPLSVVFYPLAKNLPGAPLVTFDRIWVAGLLILLVSLPVTKASRPTRWMTIALGMMAAIYLVRGLTSPSSELEPTSGIVRTAIDILVLPLILFMVTRRAVARERGLPERIAFSMMIAGAILGAIGVGEHMFGFHLPVPPGAQVRFDETIGQVRVSGPYIAPETYGLTVLMCLAATLYWLQLRLRSRWPVAVVPILLEIAAVSFTYFRVGWISAILVLLVAFAFRPRKLGRAVVVSAALGLVVALVYVQLSSFSSFATRVQNTDNFFSRLGSYEQAIQIWHSHPVFGVGALQYQTVASGLPTLLVNDVESQPDPHNSYLGVLAELGIVGFAALVLLTVAIVRLIRAMNRNRHTHDDALLAAAVVGGAMAYAIYAISLFIFQYDPSNQFFAILLGMAAGRIDMAGVQGIARASVRPVRPRRMVRRQGLPAGRHTSVPSRGRNGRLRA
jgi:O-antigen ligase